MGIRISGIVASNCGSAIPSCFPQSMSPCYGERRAGVSWRVVHQEMNSKIQASRHGDACNRTTKIETSLFELLQYRADSLRSEKIWPVRLSAGFLVRYRKLAVNLGKGDK